MVQKPPLREPAGHVETREQAASTLGKTVELPLAVEILNGLSDSEGMALH
jgi:hypothetical protein